MNKVLFFFSQSKDSPIVSYLFINTSACFQEEAYFSLRQGMQISEEHVV